MYYDSVLNLEIVCTSQLASFQLHYAGHLATLHSKYQPWLLENPYRFSKLNGFYK